VCQPSSSSRQVHLQAHAHTPQAHQQSPPWWAWQQSWPCALLLHPLLRQQPVMQVLNQQQQRRSQVQAALLQRQAQSPCSSLLQPWLA
jgi:hypothetical protein